MLDPGKSRYRFSWTSTTTFLICSRQFAEGLEPRTTFAANARAATTRIILGEPEGNVRRSHRVIVSYGCQGSGEASACSGPAAYTMVHHLNVPRLSNDRLPRLSFFERPLWLVEGSLSPRLSSDDCLWHLPLSSPHPNDGHDMTPI